MKKIYAFFAAALMSVSLFAGEPASIPAVANLSAVGDLATDVVLCLYLPDGENDLCNDVVLAGSYNGWATDDVSAMKKFEPLEGFAGWYVVSFTWAEGAAGKPVQLNNKGEFEWKYQSGDADAWIQLSDGKTATIEAGYDGESNNSYPEAGAYIYQIAYWKLHNTPCQSVPTHKYTVVVKDPYCDAHPEYVPAIAGEHNSWTPTALEEGTHEGDFAWIATIETEEGNGFKFLEYTYFVANNSWDNQFEWYDEGEDKWKQFGNQAFPVATQDTTLVFDYSDTEKFHYPQCDATDETFTVHVSLIAPAGAPEKVEIIGSFDGWTGTEMQLSEGKWVALLEEVKDSHEFKFRTGIGEGDEKWSNQIQLNGENLENIKFADKWADGTGEFEGIKVVSLDFSDEGYAWTSPAQGIENIVLTEKAQKVVVDGVIYIVRDNKMFNVHGAQVR